MHVEKHGHHWIGQPVAGQCGQVPVSMDRGAFQRTLQGKAPRWGVSELGSHSSFDWDLEQLSPDHHLPLCGGRLDQEVFPRPSPQLSLAVLFLWARLGRKGSPRGG